jgi:hypothetical protein
VEQFESAGYGKNVFLRGVEKATANAETQSAEDFENVPRGTFGVPQIPSTKWLFGFLCWKN